MNVSSPFIIRPIATTLLMVAVVLVGLLGYRMLPVAALPTVDFPSIQVVTTYPGASPDVMQSSVSAPLEYQLARIPGLTLMTSTSSYGTSQITLQFSLSRDIASAGQDVQAAINAATGWLPVSALPCPPIYHKVNPADMPVLVLALTSETMPLHAITEFAATAFVPKLSQIDGVGEVSIQGGQARAVRLQANPRKLAALGLSLVDVRKAIAATTVDVPKGQIDGAASGLSDRQQRPALRRQSSFSNAVVAYRNGAPVMFKDVGEAVEGLENEKLAGWYNGKPAVILNVQRQPGANIIKVADAVQKLLPEIEKSSPRALKFAVAADRTTTIRAAVVDVQRTLAITVALVVLVIFLFLRKFWATVIPSVTLPVSLIATFAIMAASGFSLDNLSLMALSVASGFIVDDAIVMIENIVRYIEAGDRPLDAALKGSRQIGFTIVSLTISLVAVFIPLLLMGGVVGRLFREFAITLSASIVISGLVSLVLTPMMCATLLKREEPGNQTRLFRAERAGLRRHARALRGGLRWTLRHQTMMLVFTVLTFCRQHLALYGHSERLRAGAGHRPDRRGDRCRAGHFLRKHVGAAAEGRRHHREGSRRDRRHQLCRRRHRESDAQQRPALHRYRLAGSAAARPRRRSWSGSGRPLPGCAISRCICSRCRTSRSKLGRPARSTNMSCRTSTKKSCAHGPTRFVEELRKQRRTGRCDDRSARSRPADDDHGQSRSGGALWPQHGGDRCRFSTTRSASARSPRSTTPIYQYNVILEVAPEYRNTARRRSTAFMSRRRARSWRPAARLRPGSAPTSAPRASRFRWRALPRSKSAWRRWSSRIRANSRRSRSPSICRPASRSDKPWRRCVAPSARSGLPRAIETNLVGSAAEFASSLKASRS